MLLWSMAAAAACRGEIETAGARWKDLAVRLPLAGDHAELLVALDAVAEHGRIAESLRAARTRKGRSTLPATIARARAWLDANPDAVGDDPARTALDAAEACVLPASP